MQPRILAIGKLLPRPSAHSLDLAGLLHRARNAKQIESRWRPVNGLLGCHRHHRTLSSLWAISSCSSSSIFICYTTCSSSTSTSKSFATSCSVSHFYLGQNNNKEIAWRAEA
ncbi:hypothetical protein ACLKA7_007437 [Drosophila subpalustris]